jgi:hypothetical protein
MIHYIKRETIAMETFEDAKDSRVDLTSFCESYHQFIDWWCNIAHSFRNNLRKSINNTILINLMDEQETTSSTLHHFKSTLESFAS